MKRKGGALAKRGLLFIMGGECSEKRGSEGVSKNGIGSSHGDVTGHR